MSYRVLMVQPAFSAIAYAAHARALGWDVLVASHEDGSRVVAETVRSLATEIITVDTNDSEALAAAVDEAHGRNRIDAVVAGGEFYVPAAARLAQRLGLAGLDPAGVDRVRYKPTMRQAVADAGLLVPRFAVVRDPAELEAACAHVGFPAVIKPVESGGSIHVSRVDTVEQARTALDAMYADDELEFDRPLDTDAVLEQYVAGPEYSADGYVRDGEVVVVAVTRKLLGPEPRFLEIGHLTPAPLDEDTRREITEYAAGVAKAVGVTVGPFHCELRLDGDNRPVLMEIAARLPGDRITELMEKATGLVLPRTVLAAATRSDPEEMGAYREPDALAAGIRFLTAGGSGAYTRLDGWEELTAEPWVTDAQVLIAPGAAVRTNEADYRCRVAVVVFTAGSPAEAHERWTEIGDRVRVITG